jgi:hypothetical protein
VLNRKPLRRPELATAFKIFYLQAAKETAEARVAAANAEKEAAKAEKEAPPGLRVQGAAGEGAQGRRRAVAAGRYRCVA